MGIWFNRLLRLLVVAAVFTVLLAIASSQLVTHRKLNRNVLDASLAAGRSFMLHAQRQDGRFLYEYNFVTGEFPPGDNQVRQAGATWGLALIHRENPNSETLQAVLKSLAFWREQSSVDDQGIRKIHYPGEKRRGRTGTAALVTLATIEVLQTPLPRETEQRLRKDLEGYIALLLALRTSDGRFFDSYRLRDGHPYGRFSPYSEGEALLALAKAAHMERYADLKPVILESAAALHGANVTEALQNDRDSNTTKGYYQWGTMAYLELHYLGWDVEGLWADRAVDMALWMIDVHRTLWRTKNTAYAHEGMICAYELARRTGDAPAQRKIAEVVDTGLHKLTTWQVGGPIPNRFLRNHPTKDPLAQGGVMNAKDDPVLRIDVTQHQMHAVLLARRYLYLP